MRCARNLSIAIALVLSVAACTGDSPDVSGDATPDAIWTPDATAADDARDLVADPTPAPSPTPGPTATPRPVAENDVLRAAVDAYETDPLPEGTRSFDVLARTVRSDGRVALTVCSWDAQSVANTVVDVVYEVDGDVAGDLVAVAEDWSVGSEPCVNSDMLEAALEFIDEEQITTADDMEAVAPWAGRRLPSDLVVAPAWRDVDASTLDIGYCVEMNPDSPRSDDTGEGDGEGGHLVRWIRLGFDVDDRPQWSALDSDHLPWQDCRGAASWPRILIDWQPGGIWRLAGD